MKVIDVRNVNHALFQGVGLLMKEGVARGSRNGPVLEIAEPVATVYRRPHERVLFLPERDANPFFHFMEGLWILAGSDKLSFVSWFNRRMSEYSDNGTTLHGAYGSRMRNTWKIDQIEKAIEELVADPLSRQVVIQIWSAGMDLGSKTKDKPCNTQVYLKLRGNELCMTVCCRSNDMIWGAYGANAVHWSMVQEYIAGQIANRLKQPIALGPYTQISDSFHVYTDVPMWAVLAHLLVEAGGGRPDLAKRDWYENNDPGPLIHDFVDSPAEEHPLILQPTDAVDIGAIGRLVELRVACPDTGCPLIDGTARPMIAAWHLHRGLGHTYAALAEARNIAADDWRAACVAWLERRLANSKDRR